ncbi:MAG: radical SAM protein [Clostridia bacterium]|nr:radical SAM protein [Clostridia bacterium]
MNIARILYPVRVLGPGERVGLWLCGCNRGCKGCSNPELWQQKPEFEITTDNLLRLIHKISDAHPVDGFTISGGEPFDQAQDLSELVKEISVISDDILIYSGYKLEELRSRNDTSTEYILNNAAVLIDGAYMEELNDNSLLRGSSNQKIHILNSQYSVLYQKYLSETHNQIQNFTTADGIVSVGIHKKDFSN